MKTLFAALALSALGLAGAASAQQIFAPEAYTAGRVTPPPRPNNSYDYNDPRTAPGAPRQATPRYGTRTPRANRYDPTLAPDSSYTPILKNYRDAPPVQRFEPQPRGRPRPRAPILY